MAKTERRDSAKALEEMGCTISVNGGEYRKPTDPEFEKEMSEVLKRGIGKSQTAQAIIDAPHSSVSRAAIKGNAEDVGGVSGQRLKSFIERVERLEEEKSGIAEDIKDIFAEAKGVGFDTKTMRKVIRLRKMDKEKRREEDEILDLYKAAIGLE